MTWSAYEMKASLLGMDGKILTSEDLEDGLPVKVASFGGYMHGSIRKTDHGLLAMVGLWAGSPYFDRYADPPHWTCSNLVNIAAIQKLGD
jgi:hypothetical protein